ncbi:stalk domain-containing protein [Paenibacillus zanthoxyli]|uniref:stalk domain-containing protein n=1 Tax=Paenibacillus zanthoxyli TaxID=369399 RepID=UPI000471182F|nr:stalk domain-containing protein [Paenibacillus zanthoxyli]
MRKIRWSIFVLLLISLVLPVSSQAASMKTNGRVHLKINQYYVLYAAPKEPYLLNSRLYLPLRSVSQLLGAKVDYDGKRKWVKIQLNNHVLEINMMTNQTFY